MREGCSQGGGSRSADRRSATGGAQAHGRMPLADLLGGDDALVGVAGRHPDVDDRDVRTQAVRDGGWMIAGSPAVPTTSKPTSVRSRARPSRRSSASSAITTRMGSPLEAASDRRARGRRPPVPSTAPHWSSRSTSVDPAISPVGDPGSGPRPASHADEPCIDGRPSHAGSCVARATTTYAAASTAGSRRALGSDGRPIGIVERSASPRARPPGHRPRVIAEDSVGQLTKILERGADLRLGRATSSSVGGGVVPTPAAARWRDRSRRPRDAAASRHEDHVQAGDVRPPRPRRSGPGTSAVRSSAPGSGRASARSRARGAPRPPRRSMRSASYARSARWTSTATGAPPRRTSVVLRDRHQPVPRFETPAASTSLPSSSGYRTSNVGSPSSRPSAGASSPAAGAAASSRARRATRCRVWRRRNQPAASPRSDCHQVRAPPPTKERCRPDRSRPGRAGSSTRHRGRPRPGRWPPAPAPPPCGDARLPMRARAPRR